MAWGKGDFVDFGDLDLADLLGEYTCSEIDSDDDSVKPSKVAKD